MSRELENAPLSLKQGSYRRILAHIASLGTDDDKVALRAERTLIRYYAPRATDLLIRASGDANPCVRFRVAWVLGQSKDPMAFDTLLRLTADSDHRVRYDAAIALGILGDPRCIRPLIDLAAQPDPRHSVDGAALAGLDHVHELAASMLIESICSPDPVEAIKAAYVLGQLVEAQAVPALSARLNGPDEGVKNACQAAIDRIAANS